MEQGLIEKATMQDIADAIREKDGSTEGLFPSEMADAIRAISTGGAYETNIGQITLESRTTVSSTVPFSIAHGLNGVPDFFI